MNGADSCSPCTGRRASLTFVLFLLGSLIGWSLTVPAHATQREAGLSFDLAASVPTPLDLANAGLDGFGLYRALFQDHDDLALQLAEESALQLDSVRAVLQSTGFQQAYVTTLALPSVANDSSSAYRQEVVAYVRTFTDDAGAALAFDLFRRASGEAPPGAPAPIPSSDDARWTRIERMNSSGAPSIELHVDLRIGSVLVGVALIDGTGEEPAVIVAEALARRLLERLDQAMAHEDAPLSRQAVVMAGQDIFLGGQYYQWLDGEAIREYGASDEATQANAELMTQIGALRSFHVWQRMPVGMGGPQDDMFFYSTVTRFENEAAASSSLDALLDTVSREGFEEVNVIPEAAGLGDQSTGYTARISWEAQGTAYTFWYRVYVIRVGAVTGNVMLIAPEPPPPETVENLAVAQTLCLEAGDCGGQMTVATGLGGNEGLAFDPEDARPTPSPSP